MEMSLSHFYFYKEYQSGELIERIDGAIEYQGKLEELLSRNNELWQIIV